MAQALQQLGSISDAAFAARLLDLGLSLKPAMVTKWRRIDGDLAGRRPGHGIIAGLCAPFGQWASIPDEGLEESFVRGCFTTACNATNITLRINHAGPILGTVAGGALSLYEFERGLYATIHLSAIADRVVAEMVDGLVRAGSATGWSITFLRDSCHTLEGRSPYDGARRVAHAQIGTIKEISLSVNTRPAYESTWAAILDVTSMARLRRERIEAIEAQWARLNGELLPLENLSDQMPARPGFGFSYASARWIRGIDETPGTRSFLQLYEIESGGRKKIFQVGAGGPVEVELY
jgi:phage head maturation protease